MAIQGSWVDDRVRETAAKMARHAAAIRRNLDQDLLDLQDLEIMNHALTSSTQPANRNDLDPSDPDGLNDQIRGKYRELLTEDPQFLLARRWGVKPWTLTHGINRKSVAWVRQQIEFVDSKKDSFFTKGRAQYLSRLLKSSKF